tara:strand:+ start:270 stop:560 length:291 start_codon:yes stop_codon:yes gene_type:complete
VAHKVKVDGVLFQLLDLELMVVMDLRGIMDLIWLMVEQGVDLLVDLETKVAAVELDIMVVAVELDFLILLLLEVEVVVDRDIFLQTGLTLFLNKVV